MMSSGFYAYRASIYKVVAGDTFDVLVDLGIRLTFFPA